MNIKSKLNNLFSVLHDSRFKINRRGFTLIEMLIVIAIISILSSVFLVGLRGFRGGAYDSRRLADLQKTQSYLEIYYTANRIYPDVDTWVGETSSLTSALLNLNVTLPNDPITSQSYAYCQTDGGQGYMLAATFSGPHSALDESSEIDNKDLPEGTFPSSCTNDTGAPSSCDDDSFNFCIKF